MSFSSFTCASLRTMLTSGMPSLMQILLSIWPRLEAAAVCTSALKPSIFICSVKPSEVRGLTNIEAPSATLAPSGRMMQSRAFSLRTVVYIAPPSMPTVLPIMSDTSDPAAITVPAPSLPTAMDSPTRPFTMFMVPLCRSIVSSGRSALPPLFMVERSAGPSSRPRSDGLIGVASTRTTTSSAAGASMVTSSRLSTSVPASVIVDLSSRPWLVSLMQSSPLLGMKTSIWAGGRQNATCSGFAAASCRT